MFSQLTFMRLRAAEKAAKDGRLDEAFRLAYAQDLRSDLRAQAILKLLAPQLLERARAHYRADQFVEALSDLDRAQVGQVLTKEIDELRGQIKTVSNELHRNQQSRHDRIINARRRIEDGSLIAGRKILEQASVHDAAAKALNSDINHRTEDAEELIRTAKPLIAQGQFAEAAKRLLRAKRINAYAEQAMKLELELCVKVLKTANDSLQQGRIKRAETELNSLGKIGESDAKKRDLLEAVRLSRKASQSLRTFGYADARRHLMSLDRVMPKIKWVSQAITMLSDMEQQAMTLLAGPLGEASESKSDAGLANARKLINQPVSDETIAIPNRRAPAKVTSPTADQLLLLVDGGGSYLILRGNETSIGRAACNHPADMPLLSDIAERHASVQRVEDDYFFSASKKVDIAGHATTHKLLRDGERVVLGRKAKFTFRTPSRRSASAVLDLSDTTKMPNDVRRVILFDRHAMLSSSPSAHILCRHAGVPLILFERGGEIWIRAKNDGHVDTEAKRLPMGESIEIAGVTLVLSPWTMRLPGERHA